VRYVVSDCPHNRDAYNVYRKIRFVLWNEIPDAKKFHTHCDGK
jgi:hypothetical protein